MIMFVLGPQEGLDSLELALRKSGVAVERVSQVEGADCPEAWDYDIVLVGCDVARTGHLQRDSSMKPYAPNPCHPEEADRTEDQRPWLVAYLPFPQ
jgi:hypothetical protein